jgi:hypothetical protein
MDLSRAIEHLWILKRFFDTFEKVCLHFVVTCPSCRVAGTVASVVEEPSRTRRALGTVTAT